MSLIFDYGHITKIFFCVVDHSLAQLDMCHQQTKCWLSPETVNIIQSGPETNAQSLMHRHFAITICNRITRLSPKCSETIIVYQSMHNLYQLVKYSLINSRNCIQCYERRHPACEQDTFDSWRSTANKDFANWKKLDCWKMIVEFPVRQWK